MQPAVFLDRDGTLIEEVGLPRSPRAARVLPVQRRRGPAAEPRRVSRCVVVTNQAGIARGHRSTSRSSSEAHRAHRGDARRAAARAIDGVLLLPASSGRRRRRVSRRLRLPQAAAGAVRAGGGRSRPRPRALVRRRRSLARRRARAWRSARAACSCAPATARTHEAAPGDARRRRRRGQPDGAPSPGFCDSRDAITSRTHQSRRRAPTRPAARARRRFRRTPRRRSFGDLIADEFIYGEIARVSREAPVLILELRLDRDRAGRRRQRGEQRRGARRRARWSSASPAATTAGRRLLEALAPRVDVSGVAAAGRLSHADQDAHPRRRRPLGQAAGRAHRSRARPDRRRRGRARRSRRALARAVRGCRRAARLRLRHRAWSRPPRSPSAARRGPQRPAPGRSCSSTRATRCCGSAA